MIPVHHRRPRSTRRWAEEDIRPEVDLHVTAMTTNSKDNSGAHSEPDDECANQESLFRIKKLLLDKK